MTHPKPWAVTPDIAQHEVSYTNAIEQLAMSFLVRDTDERATLEATLAFLDAWDVPGTDSSGADSPVDAPARCQTPQQKQQATRRKKPRRKYPNSSSTALQRRKKAEILALRTQVELLELQLEQLQKVPAGASATYLLQLEHVGVQPTTWAQQAVVEYRGRLEAEQTNHKLKSIMANQVKVNEALRTLLQKTSVLEGMDFLQPDPCRPLSMELSGMELLERKVERLYFDADAVFQPQAAAAISVQATEKQSPSLGKTMEFVSNTPMQCPLRVASDTLWKWFSLNKVRWVLQVVIGPRRTDIILL
ncbi:unnamed protein product [Phytophthora lilii]|uniref:Unnamed protein product n=1 Tax=Phytophthora lilii TaxID=2077276 RepID=A0A9W6WT38_9STRA|nr:unnamed protein product [Phytophthora lilii]